MPNTDESGFKMVNTLGGQSIRVGRFGATAAARRLANVDAVRQWLAQLADPTRNPLKR